MSAFAPTRYFLGARSRVIPCSHEAILARNGTREIRHASFLAVKSIQCPRKAGTSNAIVVPKRFPKALNMSQRRTNGTVSSNGTSKLTSKSRQTARAYIALGSNVGNRLEMIEKACQALNEDADIAVIRTSCLYETEPMYVEEQARFLNGACEVCTSQLLACTEG